MRNKPSTPFMYYFGAYSELCKLTLQTNEMLPSSAIVIFHRNKLINQAMNGQLSWMDPEFTQIWQEKIAAGAEAYLSLVQSAAEWNLSGSLSESIKIIAKSTKPYHTKTKSNARRLSKTP